MVDIVLWFLVVIFALYLVVIIWAVIQHNKWNRIEHKDAFIYWMALQKLGEMCMYVDWNSAIDLDRNDPVEESIRDAEGWREWAIEQVEEEISNDRPAQGD